MIKLYNLMIGYKNNIINNPLNGYFKSGSMTAIIGRNGIGKSTLLKTIAGLISPFAGYFKFNTINKPNISYLPQKINIDCKFPLTVFEVVAMGTWPAIGLLDKINSYQHILINQAIKCVGLNDILYKTIGSLSAGQFRRMLFARLLVQQAPIILLDEPFINIDNKTCDTLMQIILQLYHKGTTIIVVLHDMNLVTKYFPDILLLTQKRITWGPYSRTLIC